MWPNACGIHYKITLSACFFHPHHYFWTKYLCVCPSDVEPWATVAARRGEKVWLVANCLKVGHIVWKGPHLTRQSSGAELCHLRILISAWKALDALRWSGATPQWCKVNPLSPLPLMLPPLALCFACFLRPTLAGPGTGHVIGGWTHGKSHVYLGEVLLALPASSVSSSLHCHWSTVEDFMFFSLWVVGCI